MIIKPGDSLKKNAENDIGTVKAVPIFVGDNMFLRSDKFSSLIQSFLCADNADFVDKWQ